MKKLTLIFLLIAISNINLLAQRPSSSYDKEKLEAARVAFITNRLDLKAEQAEKFWPVFNQFNEERGKLMHQLSAINRSSSEEMTEAKAREMIAQRMSLQQDLLDMEKLFMDEIVKIISPIQAVKLGGVNREFTRQVYRMQRGRDKND
ncbi:hypothetical protein SAMN00777080_4238 [Aquiflexum balticum DSM 16537]|uniref:LTXXQ motif family protein n=1 Tax=Aquiflexum balticum DSM 16537 TaxID=758820 RepID=A0A1W2H9S4_9BACT|nr:hypothetical protein [Aquiflexum balticum]SMD45581.1 hypothetical protein SAMN00777080_4238 [Aquiflexum balticum DSM 16537]